MSLRELPPRIFGVETEYGITCASTTGGEPPLDADAAGRLLFAEVLQRTRATNAYLPNGGRIYLDVGSHPEYATAECSTVEELLAQDRAGIAMLQDMTEAANRHLAEQGVQAQIHLFKNNLDSAGNSCGCHENYLLHRSRQYRSLVDSLVSFFITRQLITGAGWIRVSEGKADYCLSQRAYQTFDAVSAATTRSRPLVNTRDEPHADASLYRRLHVISGDSNVLEGPTAFKVGATNLLLAALEDGMRMEDLVLADPMRAIREITADLSGATEVELADGRRWTALQLLGEIRQRLGNHLRDCTLTGANEQVFALWDKALAALGRGHWEDLAEDLDWAAKLRLIRSYQERTGAGLEDVRIARLDLAYHDIGPQGLHLDERGLARRWTTPDAVSQALEEAPQTTRAAMRGAMIRLAAEHRRDLTVDWTHLRLDGGDLPTVLLTDPFATTVEALKGLDRAISGQ